MTTTGPVSSEKPAESGSALSVVLAGGGSTGHVSPLLAVAAALKKQSPQSTLLAVGSADGIETRLVPLAGLELATIERVPFPRRPNMAAVTFLPRFLKAVKQSRKILRDTKADALVGVGGYICTPMYFAAHRLGIPIVIHEANVRPGLANRWGARYSKHLGTAFPQSDLPGAQLVGMPMNQEIATLDRQARRAEARQALGLDPDLPTVVVTGGSLGAESINQTVAQSLPQLAAAGIQVLHLTGKGKALTDDAGQQLSAENYHQVEYLDTMAYAYAAADLLISRSGAGTVSEVAAVGVPAVFVPLPIGNGEQGFNAAQLVDHEAALMVANDEFTVEWLQEHVIPLVKDSSRLTEISQRAAQLGHRDAAEQMAAITLEAAHGK